MDTFTKKCFIFDLNNVINEFARKKNLFSGGCCFSAYLLAKAFIKAGINYRTVLYQDGTAIAETDFNTVLNGSGCGHVAIEVTVDRKRVTIGDCDGLVRYYNMFGIPYAVNKYHDITPKMLLNAYLSNDWNNAYDTSNNGPLAEAITKIVNKYVPKI